MYKFDVLNVTVMIMQYMECHMQSSTVNQSLIHGFPETQTIFNFNFQLDCWFSSIIEVLLLPGRPCLLEIVLYV